MVAFLFALISCVFSVEIKRLNFQQTLDTIKEGWTFILAADSNDFEFVTILRNFKNAAHLSTIDAKFVVLDVSIDNVEPAQLNISQFPAVIFAKEGQCLHYQYRGFDEDYLMSFFATNAINPPSVISTKEELDTFYATTGVGVIIAFEDATPEKYPELVNFYYNHFAEVVIAFAKPALLPEGEGYYLYRYIDSNLVKLNDLSKLNQKEIATEITSNFRQEFTKLNGLVAGYYEELKQRFVVLMLIMEDFYLTAEQLELARNIKKQTGLNVTYADVENSQTLAINYGLPDSLDSTMAVIDHTKPRTLKYMLDEALNLDSALKLIRSVESGTATPYFKSEAEGHSTKIGCQITSISSKTLLELVKTKKSAALAVYYASHDPMEEFVNATAIVKTAAKDAVFGKFSMNTNDWPLEEFDQTLSFPLLFVLKNGKNVYTGELGNTTEAVTLQITDALAKNAEL
ncbi:hypothetical protein TRFO_17445 [Tritrichomonas foetus]|uniref:Thioredoxin domain-containing protein n=1 Tax=Tritrichomonas foetus TaxID=1144522 RepID=A0A1J4KSC6_9EUKA|nr:hypothetical protein TRFO_17445 [Tritrichomonas foetus]|eukprot:OHT12716.1 hypothetical protein TRFO_17445 [Tritrichomonas foetus]